MAIKKNSGFKNIPPETEMRVLKFINAVESAEELAEAVEIPGRPDVGIKIASSLMVERERIGEFSTLSQIDDIRGIGPKRLADIVETLSKVESNKTLESWEEFIGDIPQDEDELLFIVESNLDEDGLLSDEVPNEFEAITNAPLNHEMLGTTLASLGAFLSNVGILLQAGPGGGIQAMPKEKLYTETKAKKDMKKLVSGLVKNLEAWLKKNPKHARAKDIKLFLERVENFFNSMSQCNMDMDALKNLFKWLKEGNPGAKPQDKKKLNDVLGGIDWTAPGSGGPEDDYLDPDKRTTAEWLDMLIRWGRLIWVKRNWPRVRDGRRWRKPKVEVKKDKYGFLKLVITSWVSQLGKVKAVTQSWPVDKTKKKEAEAFAKNLKKEFDKCNYPRKEMSSELKKLKDKT